MKPSFRTHWSLIAMLALGGLAHGHAAHDHADHTPPAVRDAEQVQVRFIDVPLVDQYGQQRNLERDLIADKIVVLGLIYTSCTTVCPVVSSIMARTQKQLGGRVGQDVQLLSITVDPLRDTPQRLLEYARQYQSGQGWSWLTGTPQAIEQTLKGLGSAPGRLEDHPPLILVGDGRSGRWTRFYGFADPEQLLARIHTYDLAREHAARRFSPIVHDHHARVTP